jgi:predicted DNA-binding protein with PD1-like motif
MGKLSHGADLLEELTRICSEENVKLGRVEALGAVQKARVGFYNQTTRKYQYMELSRTLEITKLVGNISIKDGAPMVHAHITFSDEQGNAFGGHLAQGTIVFACEFVMEVFDGPEFVRAHDAETDLPLWRMDQ